MQNLAFSCLGFQLSRIRYSKSFYRYLSWLKKTEWWSADEIHQYQNSQILHLVKHAYNTVPFYKRWYDKEKVEIGDIRKVEDLHYLPILTKELVRKNNKDMISTSVVYKDRHNILTSGTTGTPIDVKFTKEGLAFQWAIWWRHKMRFGLKISDKHLQFGARVPVGQNVVKPPFWRKDTFLKRTYVSSYHISEKTVRDIVSLINNESYIYVTGYPSIINEFASIGKELDLEVFQSPTCVVTGSDALTATYKRQIGDYFGCVVTEQYGMAEFAGNMSRCENEMFHLDFECCYMENIVNTDQNLAKIIFTGWGNYSMPFIRYEVGDMSSPTAECTCGRNSQAIESIVGRLEDYILTPDGRKIIGMNQVLEYASGAREIQIVQETPEAIEFHVVPSNRFGEDDKNALVREFERRAGFGMTVTFKVVDTIEYSSQGKKKAVVSKLGSVDR